MIPLLLPLAVREARDGLRRIVATVLGLERDAAHANHFHLDLGRWSTCL